MTHIRYVSKGSAGAVFSVGESNSLWRELYTFSTFTTLQTFYPRGNATQHNKGKAGT